MEIMIPFLPVFILMALMSPFFGCSADISRKGLRIKDENQALFTQSSSLVQSGRIDPTRVVQLSWQPRVFVYRGFISDEECDHLISMARGKTSSVVNNTRGMTTRSLASFDEKDEVIARVEERISAWTLLPLENSRPLQVLHYTTEEAKQKYDYFGNKSAWQVSEPLMATVILHLSNVSRGGEISFPESQLKTSQLKSKAWPYFGGRNNLLKPVKGNAILFFNVHPNTSPDPSSNHVRSPVFEGGMWCATKFFHLRAIREIQVPSDTENSDCTDEDESCPQWAALGECKRNPVFMVGSPDYYGTCRKSCKVC